MAALGPLPRLGLGPPSKEPQLALRLCAMPSPTLTPREEGSNSMASFGCCRYSRREPSSMASVLVARLPGSPSRTHAGSGTSRRLSLVEALRLLTCGVENRNPRSAQWCQTHSSVTASAPSSHNREKKNPLAHSSANGSPLLGPVSDIQGYRVAGRNLGTTSVEASFQRRSTGSFHAPNMPGKHFSKTSLFSGRDSLANP